MKKIQAGDGGQRHGRRAHAGGAAQDRARPLRDHGIRGRAPPQLQPHHAVACAGGRAAAGRYHPQRLVLVCAARHHPACGLPRARSRPGAPRGARRGRGRTAGERRVRPADPGHGLAPLHAARARARAGRRAGLPRHCRHPGHDRGGRQPPPCRGHRRRPAGPGGRQRTHEARHGRYRGACGRAPAGPPAGRNRRRLAAGLAGRARHALSDAGPDPGADGRRPGPRGLRAPAGRARGTGLAGGHGRGHPARDHAGRADAPARAARPSWSATRCRP